MILTELVKLEAEASRRVGTVSSCDGGLDQLNAVNSEARQALQLLNDKLSELEHIANEQDSEAHRQLLLDRVKRAKIQHQRFVCINQRKRCYLWHMSDKIICT